MSITGGRGAFKRNGVWALIAILGILAAAWWGISTSLNDAFQPGPTEGPFTADGVCPRFAASYPSCEIRFGNRGLSTLNSAYETFVGEGAFEIDGFTVVSRGPQSFEIIAQSNRGPIRSQILADKMVRLGQEREDEEVNRTHEASFCDAGRIYQHQVGYADGDVYEQDLEFWVADKALRFRLFQNGSPTADVVCQPVAAK